ncbi:MAG: hypothetical protein VX106_02015 [Pseudomonadota bacterium]|nr:hypothetical protein [Pseudomonadota bacterium]
MTHATNDTVRTAQIFANLADEAWQQLGSRTLADLTLAEIAAHVDVEAGLAVALAGDLQQLILGKMAALDDQAVLESFADIEDAGVVPTREKVLEAILHRFEVYAPYRAQVQALNRAARARPDLALALGLGLHAVTRRMLAMAGDDCDGWRGSMRVKGVAGVVMFVARTWMKDDSPDLAPTMKELDRRLQQAEEWADSLQLFQQSRRRRGQASVDEDDEAGHYGVNND